MIRRLPRELLGVRKAWLQGTREVDAPDQNRIRVRAVKPRVDVVPGSKRSCLREERAEKRLYATRWARDIACTREKRPENRAVRPQRHDPGVELLGADVCVRCKVSLRVAELLDRPDNQRICIHVDDPFKSESRRPRRAAVELPNAQDREVLPERLEEKVLAAGILDRRHLQYFSAGFLKGSGVYRSRQCEHEDFR